MTLGIIDLIATLSIQFHHAEPAKWRVFIVLLNVVIFIVVGLSVAEPGSCTIKLFTAVIYEFYNKLECLSLASLPSLV